MTVRSSFDLGTAAIFWPILGALAACGSPATTPAKNDAAGGQGGFPTSAGGAAGSSQGVGGSAAGTGGSSGTTNPPRTCAEAAPPYTVTVTPVESSAQPITLGGGFGSRSVPDLPLGISADGSRLVVAFTTDQGGTLATVVAEVGGASFTIADSVVGGVAATASGAGALVFDPNQSADERRWAKVVRANADGSGLVETDLFRSANLEDEGTKGAPRSGRLGYIAESDLLVPYFGHTQRYSDGVRHQGGYLATVNAAGTQDVLSGWFGSHNLDQRLVTDAAGAAVIGLGDAYPEGIFFSYVNDDARPEVLYALAAAGNGATNGQLGGIVDVGETLLIPFITNNSIPQDLDAGTWPDIDEAISDQIRAAAANGTDLGLLVLPQSADNPDDELQATWLDAARPDGARLERLKSARYGAGELVLLAWAERQGQGNSASEALFTMVIDKAGAICQPKSPLAAEHSFSAGDDIISAPDGTVRWARRSAGGGIEIVTLTPG